MNLEMIIKHLLDNKVVVMETDTVLGLSTVLNTTAIKNLQNVKQLSDSRGIIIVSKYIEHFLPFVDFEKLTEEQFQTINAHYDVPTTFIVPSKPNLTWFTGTDNSNTLAIRLVSTYPIGAITELLNAPVASTSANIHGRAIADSSKSLFNYFGTSIIYTKFKPQQNTKPSKIINIITGEIVRNA